MDIVSNKSFLAKALSVLLGQRVEQRPDDDSAYRVQKISMDTLHKSTLIFLGSAPDLSIEVKTLWGKTITVIVNPADTIKVLKDKIMDVTGCPPDQQALVFEDGRRLEDGRDVSFYTMENGTRIHMVLGDGRGRGSGPYYTWNPEDFDENYNYDFTNLTPSSTAFHRGGRPYQRPFGWMRIGIKLAGKYEGDSTWLGVETEEPREGSAPGEWPVSYHGTSEDAAKNIAAEGFDPTKGKRFLFGPGIYSTPNPAKAATFAKKFEWEGKLFKVMMQNRVNMEDTTVIPDALGSGTDYYVTAKAENIRPYGILVRDVSP